MKKTLVWIFIVFSLLMYMVLVYSWLLEGNRNRRQQEFEQKLYHVRLSQRLSKH